MSSRVEECDVRSARLTDLVGGFAPHVVVHLAAQVGVPASVLHGDGRATRDFVHVDDVTDAVLRACTTPAAGRVNIGSGVETSVAEVRALISDATGQVVAPRHGDTRIGDIERMCLRIDRAATALEWSPRIGLAEGIAALAPTAMGVSA